jgi:hypothetical protein
MAPVGRMGGTKIGNNIFKPGRYNICTLNSEMKAKWHCCRSEMGDGNARQSSHERFVVCPQLKSMIFTKMAKMPDYCMCSQQLMIKRVGLSGQANTASPFGSFRKWNCFHPFGCVIDGCENVVATITVL